MSSTLHLRTRRTLCRLLSGGGEPDREAVIEALLAIGAIGGDEAEEWRVIAREVMTSPQADVGRLASRAELLLKEAEAAIHAAPADDDKEAEGMRAWWLAEALREAGLLTEPEEDAWSARFEEAEGFDEDDDDLGPRGAQFAEVRRVIEPPLDRIDGIRLTSIEICDDGVLIRWHHSLPELETRETFGDDDPDMPHDLDPELEDDLDTRYYATGGGYGGSDSQGWGNWQYDGRVPEAARRLRLGRGQTSWEIDLT